MIFQLIGLRLEIQHRTVANDAYTPDHIKFTHYSILATFAQNI